MIKIKKNSKIEVIASSQISSPQIQAQNSSRNITNLQNQPEQNLQNSVQNRPQNSSENIQKISDSEINQKEKEEDDDKSVYFIKRQTSTMFEPLGKEGVQKLEKEIISMSNLPSELNQTPRNPLHTGFSRQIYRSQSYLKLLKFGQETRQNNQNRIRKFSKEQIPVNFEKIGNEKNQKRFSLGANNLNFLKEKNKEFSKKNDFSKKNEISNKVNEEEKTSQVRKKTKKTPRGLKKDGQCFKLLDTFEVKKKKLTKKIEDDRKITKINKCYICQENIADCIFQPCGHGGVCFECVSSMLNHENDTCPFCRNVRKTKHCASGRLAKLFGRCFCKISGKKARILAITTCLSFGKAYLPQVFRVSAASRRRIITIN